MINVSNIEDLYTAVNDSANDGATIVLAPGTYALSAMHRGVAETEWRTPGASA